MINGCKIIRNLFKNECSNLLCEINKWKLKIVLLYRERHIELPQMEKLEFYQSNIQESSLIRTTEDYHSLVHIPLSVAA
jgi:hypothetical protein